MQEKIVTLRDVIMVRWNQLTIDEMRRSVAVTLDLGREYNNKAWSFFVIPSALPIPDAFTRAEMSKHLGNLLSACEALCVVIEGRGLKHATARTVAASFVLVSGRNMHVFGSLQEAFKGVNVPNADQLLELARKEGIIGE